MLTINIDQEELRRLCRESIAKLIKEVDSEYVFWDSAELKKRTCMSWETVQATFFFAPGFPKRKIGGKWYYPVRETRAFLEKWLMEQPFR